MEQWNKKRRQDLCRKQGLAPKKKPRQNGCGGASSSSKTRGSGSRTEELQSGSGEKEAEARVEQSEEEEATEENSELAYGKATSATLPRGSVGEALARNILYWEQTPESPPSPLTPDPLPTPRGPIADDAHNRAINDLVGDLYVTVPKDDEWTELDGMLLETAISAFLKEEVKPA